MIQKIIRVGNSAAVTLPKDFLKLTRASVGTEVILQPQPELGRLIVEISRAKNKAEEIIDKEVYLAAKNLLGRYKTAFRELAKR